MKRFLPTFILVLVGFVLQLVLAFESPSTASAQTTSVSPSPSVPVSTTPTPTVPSALQQNQASPAQLPTDWIIDPVVTSIGKNAARSGIFLDWAIQNYDWSYVEPGKTNPLIPFWITIRNTVYALLILVVIAGSLALIITRGRSVTLRRFLPRFLIIVVLITFSFAFVQFLYQVVDVFQGFFIRPGGVAISQKELLFVGWNYQPFVGLRALGDENFESAFISLLLVKLTSFTYYVMVGILLIRKIILWFFIMVSPFFPLLLMFYPLRNTAKIWLGEFFRWLLYAPLFAIFLAGLVSLWKTGIPLLFNFSEAGKGVIFPTAVSILLGGPLQKVGIANSVNLADTFGLYFVALLMLWMVIIFPFILLQIFLDYLSNINVNQNALARQFVNFMARFPPQPPGGAPPPGSTPTGLARALPFLRDFAIPKAPTTTGLAREIPRQTQQQNQQQTVVVRPVSVQQRETIQRMVNVAIPNLRDIAQYDSRLISRDTQRQNEVSRVRESLEKIASPATIQTTIDRERYSQIRDQLTRESRSGNQLATTILSAAGTVARQAQVSVQNITSITNILNQLANPATVTSTREREKVLEVRERLVKERDSSNTLATRVLSMVNTMTTQSKNTMQTFTQTIAHPQELSAKLQVTVNQVKETILKESEKGNSFAQYVLQLMQTKGELPKDAQTVLEKARSDGNPLAEKLLAVAKETSTEKQKEEITKLQTEIAKAKEKGDPLATLLSDMVTPKPKIAAKPDLFPTTNRVQEVSLDDYEAVKKMWTENYQQLETSGNIDEKEAQRTSIQNDIQEISDTIGLLTSQDAEKVEEGMQKVSDILPFLLIGGFSQSEIVAYLKAKQEAAKDVLSDITKQLGDEDTKITVEKRKAESPQSATMSAEIAESEPAPIVESIERKPSIPEVIHRASPQMPMPQFVATATDHASTQMLRLANISLPSIRTIAAYDESLVSKDVKRSQDVRKIQDALRFITKPTLALDEATRLRYTAIQDTLKKESDKGNTLAKAILSAGNVTTFSTPSLDGKALSQLLQSLTTVRQPGENEAVTALRSHIRDEKSRGNVLAAKILATADQETRGQIQALTVMLTNIENPDQITDQKEQATVKDLKARLAKERANSNQLAGMILTVSHVLSEKTASSLDKVTLAVMLWENLILEKANGNELAGLLLEKAGKMTDAKRLHLFLSDVVRNMRNPEAVQDASLRKQYEGLQKTLASEKAKGNELAKKISSVVDKTHASQKIDTNVIASFYDALTKESKTDNTLAKEILGLLNKEEESIKLFATLNLLRHLHEPDRTGSARDQSEYHALRDSLQEEAQKDNVVAMSLLSAAELITAEGNELSEARKMYELLQRDTSLVVKTVQEKLQRETIRQEDILILRGILHSLQDPRLLSDATERKQYEVLLEQMMLEAQHGNEAAKAIQKTLKDTGELTVAVDQEMQMVSELYQKLLEEKERGNARALETFVFISHISLQQKASQLVTVLEQVVNPSGIDEELYKKLKQDLILKRNSGDALAALLLSLGNIFSTNQIAQDDLPAVATLLLEKLTSEREQGNTFAQSIFSLMKQDETPVQELEAAVIKGKDENDPVAQAIFAVLERGKRLPDAIVLPAKNLVQEVNLDDYEAVRSMWTESYRTLSVPMRLGEEAHSREAWLQEDVTRVQATIEKLTSANQDQIREGMQNVASILPFLLIGGFSLSEIVSYLKAKLQAAKTVLSELENNKEEVAVAKGSASLQAKEEVAEERQV